MKSVLKEQNGYFQAVILDLDASETLVFTRALVKFAEDENENYIDRLVATRMVRELQTIADTPQTEDYDFRDEQEYNDRWGTDCGWK